VLDVACSASAIVAHRLATTARYLDAHDEEIAPGALGSDIALFASMTTAAVEAAGILHSVASAYADWAEAEA